MSTSNITRQAIEAAKVLLGRELVIKFDADFTPAGKRTARVVRHARNGRRAAAHIRWYVGGKSFRSLLLTNANVDMTVTWANPRQSTALAQAELALL